MTLDDFRLTMPSQLMEDIAEMLAKRPKDALLAPFSNEDDVVLTIPPRVAQTWVLFHA
jgi:hypothetical protein